MKHFTVVALLGILMVPTSMDHGKTKFPSKPFQKISEKEITCLAKNIYYEAPDEPYEGKLAVATVTMNRVKHSAFPKTVCGVVYQRNPRGCQFSWTCGPRTTMNVALYNDAKKIAINVLTKQLRLTSIKNALYFHNTSVNPDWDDFAHPIKQIGNHIFYVVNTNEYNRNRKISEGGSYTSHS